MPVRAVLDDAPAVTKRAIRFHYDMATPFAGSEFNFSHLAYDRAVTDRVSFGYYESGHMIYLRPSTHRALTTDIAKFLSNAQETKTPTRF